MPIWINQWNCYVLVANCLCNFPYKYVPLIEFRVDASVSCVRYVSARSSIIKLSRVFAARRSLTFHWVTPCSETRVGSPWKGVLHLEKNVYVGMEGVDESTLLQDSKGGMLANPFCVWSSGVQEVWPLFPQLKLEPTPPAPIKNGVLVSTCGRNSGGKKPFSLFLFLSLFFLLYIINFFWQPTPFHQKKKKKSNSPDLQTCLDWLMKT